MGTWIVGIVLVLCVGLAVRSIVKTRKKGGSCGGDCGHCGGCH